jgi:hypothetical protein
MDCNRASARRSRNEKGRREGGKLPDKKAYLRQAVDLIKELYGRVTVSESGLRLFKAALYRGDTERPPSKRKTKKKSNRSTA